MTELQSTERRHWRRHSMAIGLRVNAPTHAVMVRSRTFDLSNGGAYVCTNQTIPIGAEVTVLLDRGANRNPLTLDAEVVRVGTPAEGRSRGFAIRFTKVTALDQAALAELINSIG